MRPGTPELNAQSDLMISGQYFHKQSTDAHKQTTVLSLQTNTSTNAASSCADPGSDSFGGHTNAAKTGWRWRHR